MLMTAAKMSTTVLCARWIAFCAIATVLLFLAMPSVELALPGLYRNSSWQNTVEEKLRDDMSKIPKEWILDPEIVGTAKKQRKIAGDYFENLLDRDTKLITALDVEELLNRMRQGKLTAVKVVTAFCKRSAYAHQLSNLLLEIGFDIALKRAQELDDYFEKHKKLIGPLHGIPLTLKDQYHVKGLNTSMGFVGWIGTFEGLKGTGKERNFESELVREFHSLGAITIGKTSLVQSLWSPETNNNILGYARNPYNQLLSTGGSSGGEGAMQALRGSAFGVGTDIGGSVSMPASYQGLFSLKPSAGRLSMKGVANSGGGQKIMPTVPGILGTSVSTLQLVFKSLLSTEPWLHDPYVLPIPWRSAREFRKSSKDYTPGFGFMPHDGIVAPHPPVSRALRIVKDALNEAGLETLNWEPPSYGESIKIHGPIARGDGTPDVWEAIKLSGEPVVPQIAHLFPEGKPPDPIPLPEYEQIVIHMQDYRERFQDYWSNSSPRTKSGRAVEAYIAPVSPYAAALPGKFHYGPYASVVNVLDYPAIVIPVTFADQAIDLVPSNYNASSEIDEKNMNDYDPEAYHGGPASIQLIGRHLDEERLLSMAQIVQNALQTYKARHETLL